MAERPLRLLSLDGGREYCLAQLFLLREILHRLGNDLNRIVVPCELFDLIAGVEMGGVVAVLLVVLRLSIDEAIEEFVSIMSTLSPTKSLDEATNAAVLVRDDESYRITPFIQELFRPPGLITQYFGHQSVTAENDEEPFTTASFRANNPTYHLISEAYDAFGETAHVACILSIGSMRNELVINLETTDGPEWAKFIARSNEDEVKEQCAIQIGHLGIYFRFDLPKAPIGQPDSKWPGAIKASTLGYVEQSSGSFKVEKCVVRLRDGKGVATTKQLRYSGGGGEKIAVYVPKPSELFVMRKGPWSAIERALIGESKMPHGSSQRVMVISGLGGSGKTQMALKFAQEYRERFQHICFIDATSTESIEACLVRYVTSQGCEHAQKDSEKSLAWFTETQGWLMIFDDVQDHQTLGQFIPHCYHGCVLITTKNKDVGWNLDVRNHLEMGPMSQDEAIEALLNAAACTSLAPGEHDHARAIVEELGCLPVALIQAGRYILKHKCLSQYLIRLRNNRHYILNSSSTSRCSNTSNHSRNQHSVYAVFDMSRNALPDKARKCLHLLSYFQYHTIPISMITTASRYFFSREVGHYTKRPAQFFDAVTLLQGLFGGMTTEELDDEIIVPLHRLSLVEIDQTADERFLRLHPLVHSWAHDMADPTTHVTNREAAIRLLSSCCGKENKALHQFLLPHINKLHSDWYSLHPNDQAAFAEVLWQVLPQKALNLWEAVYSTVAKSRPVTEVEDARLLLKLGKGYHYAGPLEKAREVDERAVEIYLKEYGIDHPDTIKAQAHLGFAYCILGMYNEAVNLQRTVFDWRRQVLGENSLETLTAAAKLAFTMAVLGSFNEAEILQQRVLERRTVLLTENHPDTMTSMSQLATTYTRMGRHEEAKELRIKVLELRRKVLGENHVDTVATSGFLAETYYSLGQYGAAMKIQEQVLQRYLEIFRPKDPQVALGMSQLARTYYRTGRVGEAEQYASQAHEIQRLTLSPENVHYKQTEELLRQIESKRAIETCLILFSIVLFLLHILTKAPFTLLSL
ncbi:hypothetical protein CPB86DRAFT_825238 [Serendipita vermifera]|nr:hypothetical protein CPB86DRAFT_825238 [Serendipita vermifera]